MPEHRFGYRWGEMRKITFNSEVFHIAMNAYLYSLATALIVAPILPPKRYTLTKLHEAGEQLFACFTQQLANIEDSDRAILPKAEAAIQVCRDYLRQLKMLALQYGFADQEEEIQ